jgi:hypothetical protein
MSAKDKIQAPVRLYKSDYEQIKKLAAQDGLSFQKVVEILLLNYAKENKTVTSVVKKYAEERKASKGKRFDETDKSSIYDRIENLSPIRHLEGR